MNNVNKKRRLVSITGPSFCVRMYLSPIYLPIIIIRNIYTSYYIISRVLLCQYIILKYMFNAHTLCPGTSLV